MAARLVATRRDFLAGSAACLTASALPRWVAAIAAPASSTGVASAPVSLGLQSFSLRRYALEPMLDVLVSLGVKRVELIPDLRILFYRFGSHFPVTDDPAAIASVLDAVKSRDISIAASGVHSVSNGEEARRLFDFAQHAGIPLLTISPDDEALDPIDELCRQQPEIRVGIHNHGPWTRYARIADLEAVLAGRAPNFGACVDTGHVIRSGEDPVEAIRRLGARVQGVHLKDQMDSGFFAAGCRLGEGKLDLPACFGALREIGFGPDKSLSLEYELDSGDLLQDLEICLRTASIAMEKA